jgi:hypothetical protein
VTTDIVLITLIAFVGLLSLPWTLYLGAKLAGYGWLRGRQLFIEDQMKEAKHGDE